MNQKNKIIILKDLWKVYSLGTVDVEALKGINIEISDRDFVSIAGPSGSGKTTLMNIIGLIDKPTRGSVFIEDCETAGLDRKALARIRRDVIGFVFQSFNLLPVLSVFENVELPLMLGKNYGAKAERRDRVNDLLEQVGLADRKDHVPAELSGGQQQRVAIARALVTHPKIVIADEPTANLDSDNGERILELMKAVNQKDGTTFVFSTHDKRIWEMANHVVFLKDGAIESEQRR
jgi:putative ABC transport system ATP-binding protein